MLAVVISTQDPCGSDRDDRQADGGERRRWHEGRASPTDGDRYNCYISQSFFLPLTDLGCVLRLVELPAETIRLISRATASIAAMMIAYAVVYLEIDHARRAAATVAATARAFLKPELASGQRNLVKIAEAEGKTSARLSTSRRVLAGILIGLSLLALISAVQAPDLLGSKKVLTDFDAFYVAGTMARHGQAAEAFQATKMLAAQQEISGSQSFMPWTYPPPYMVIVDGLARMPIGAAYLLFISVSFLFYLWVLWRIAGDYLPGVLIAIFPAIVVTVRCGQNGFLTGGLVGAFLLAFLQKRTVAGIPLGLMVIKPHLAAGIALLALFSKRWATMAIAAVIVAVAVLGSIAAFGLGIWPAFFGAVHEAGQFLAEGYYPLFRMSSVYASIRTLAGPADIAFFLQGVGGLAGIGFVLYVWRRGYDRRITAAVACAASLLVSPYNYDYDLTLLGVSGAFVMRDIIKLARPSELIGLWLLSWTATGYGIGLSTVLERTESAVTELKPSTEWSLIAPALLLLLTGAFAILQRTRTSSYSCGPRPGSGLLYTRC